MVIDHKDSNPANNTMENLRVMRTELNLARQSGPEGVSRLKYPKGHPSAGKPRNYFRFGKVLYTYFQVPKKLQQKARECDEIKRLRQKAKECDELKDSGFFTGKTYQDQTVKLRQKNGVTITEEEARKLAIARKRAMALAVFAFLKREEPGFFKGWETQRDAAGNWKWVEADFYDEFVAKWRE